LYKCDEYESECWAMKKVDTRRMQAAEMRLIRMMCGKTLRDEIPNDLLRDRTGVEDIEDHLRARLRWLGHLERMDEINLSKRVKERVPGHMMRGKPKKSWDEVMKEYMEACTSMMPKTEAGGDDAAEEWSTPINWEEDPAIRQNGEKAFSNLLWLPRYLKKGPK